MPYQLEIAGGLVRLKGRKERVMIVPTNMISKMHDEFHKILGEASKIVMREIGKSLGEAMVEVVRDELSTSVEESSLEDLLKAVVTFLSKSGFGKVKISKSDEGYFVLVEEPPSHGGGKECSFEAGVIKGIMEALTGRKWNVKVLDAGEGTCKIRVAEF